MKVTTPPNKIIQEVFIDDGGSNKVSDCLPAGMNNTATITTTSLEVGNNAVLRIRVTALTYLAFSDDKDALDAATINAAYVASPAIELFTAGTYLIASPAKFVKASAQPARIEVISN